MLVESKIHTFWTPLAPTISTVSPTLVDCPSSEPATITPAPEPKTLPIRIVNLEPEEAFGACHVHVDTMEQILSREFLLAASREEYEASKKSPFAAPTLR